MSESPIEHVTDTAFWVATYRAQETERKHPLFRDPLAAKLVEGRGRAIAAQMDEGGIVAWAVVIRTWIIDAYLRHAIDRGCDTVLNLGAGLDTRPYRMVLPPSLHWIEVDFPSVISFKQDRLAGHEPRCRLRRVPLDLGDASARGALFDDINAQSERVVVLTEGVIPYLSNDEVLTLGRDLHAREKFATWIVEYLSPRFHEVGKRARHRKQMERAPFKFNPDDWHALFRAAGWKLGEMRYTGEEGHKLGRMPPMPWWAPALWAITPKSKRDEMARMQGYARMDRIEK